MEQHVVLTGELYHAILLARGDGDLVNTNHTGAITLAARVVGCDSALLPRLDRRGWIDLLVGGGKMDHHQHGCIT